MSDMDTSAAGGNGTPTAPSGSAVSPTTGEWHSSMGFDQDTMGWLENRGLTKLDSNEALKNTITGFRNAEKFIGAPSDQLLRLPNYEKATTDELNSFYTKLGRPVTAQEYNLPIPEGQGTEFADWAKGVFHEAGIPSRSAEKIAAKWNEYVASQQNAQVEQIKQNSQLQRANLEKEWGEGFPQQEAFAKNAAASLGVDGDTIDKLQSTMGYDGVMKFFANIGEKLGEPDFLSGGQSEGPMTPTKAVARIKELQTDREWSSKYISGNVEARQEMDRLMKIAYPSS